MMEQLKELLETGYCQDHYKKKTIKENSQTESNNNCAIVSKLIDDNFQHLNRILVENFYDYITPTCLGTKFNKMHPIIVKLLKQYKPTNNLVLSMLQNGKYNDCFRHFVITGDILDLILNHECQNTIDYNFIDIIIEHMEMKIINVMKLCFCRNERLLDQLARIIDKVEDEFNNEMLCDAYKFFPESKNVIIALCGRGLTFNNDCLIVACTYCSSDGLDKVLEYSRVELNSIHFNAVIGSIYPQINNNFTHRSLYVNQKKKSKYIEEKIAILIKHGYKYNRDDVMKSISFRLKLPTLEESEFVLDKEIMDLCAKYNFFPTCKFVVESEMDLLRTSCRVQNLSKIKSIIQEFNLIPDEDCMVKACEFNSNVPVIKYLISKGGVITQKCIRIAMSKGTSRTFMALLIDNYMRQMQRVIERCKQYEDQILRLGEVPVFESKLDIANIDVDYDEIAKIKQKYENGTTPARYHLISGVRNRKLSYEKIKVHFTKLININSWIVKDNNELIDLPREVRDVIGLDEGYVDFSNIDKLICLFYREDVDNSDNKNVNSDHN